MPMNEYKIRRFIQFLKNLDIDNSNFPFWWKYDDEFRELDKIINYYYRGRYQENGK